MKMLICLSIYYILCRKYENLANIGPKIYYHILPYLLRVYSLCILYALIFNKPIFGDFSYLSGLIRTPYYKEKYFCQKFKLLHPLKIHANFVPALSRRQNVHFIIQNCAKKLNLQNINQNICICITPYRPISILGLVSKLFEKLLQ